MFLMRDFRFNIFLASIFLLSKNAREIERQDETRSMQSNFICLPHFHTHLFAHIQYIFLNAIGWIGQVARSQMYSHLKTNRLDSKTVHMYK